MPISLILTSSLLRYFIERLFKIEINNIYKCVIINSLCPFFKKDENFNSTNLPIVNPNCDGAKSEFFNKNYVIVLVNLFSNTLKGIIHII